MSETIELKDEVLFNLDSGRVKYDVKLNGSIEVGTDSIIRLGFEVEYQFVERVNELLIIVGNDDELKVFEFNALNVRNQMWIVEQIEQKFLND